MNENKNKCGPKKWPEPKKLWDALPSHVREPNPDVYRSDNYLVLDFETTTKNYGSPHDAENSILCACWKRAGEPVQTLVGSAYDMGPLLEAVRQADYIVAHHAKFELGWLHRCGMDVAEILPFCTKIAEKVLAGNRLWTLHLSDCLKRRGFGDKDAIGRLIRLGVNTTNIPMPWLAKYCAIDVLQTERLFLDQRSEMEQKELLPVTLTRNILTPVLFDMERYGLNLDTDHVDAVYYHYLNEAARLEAEFAELSGGANPKSSPQKQKLLYEDLSIPIPKDDQGREMKTDKGAIKTDAAALKALKLRTEKQKKVVASLQNLTSVKDALSKYVSKLHECAHSEGILYGDFNQTNTATHRLSSKGRNYRIQLQNFQRKFRPVVAPRNVGWFIGDGDSANIEFRAAVDLAKDAQGLQDISEGVDIHANTARVIFAGKWRDGESPKSDTNKPLRQASKAHTFKPLYGGSSGTDTQRAYFESFRKRYPAICAMQKGWTETVLRDKQLRLASGLILYWPDCKLSKDGKYIRYTTNIYDYPVQSIATAEMCTTATVYLWHLMRVAGMESFLINIVHDSAVGEIHPNEREQWSDYLAYCMNVLIVWYLKAVYDYEWVTPLASEVSMKPYWDDSDGWIDQWIPRESLENQEA